jgi:hemolysin activation/secretion protein
LLLALGSIPAGDGWAQSLPSGGIQRFERDQRLRDALDEQNRRLLEERNKPAAPQPAPQDKEPTLESAPDFLYGSVRIDGASAEFKSQLEALAAPYLNRPVSLRDLESLRIAIRDAYRSRNLLALIRIDPSGPKGGVLVITVTESRMGEVRIDSRVRHHLNDGIAKATMRASVPPGSLLRLDKLTSALLKLNDLAGVRVRSTLQAGASAGSTDVLLTVLDTDRTSGEVNINNEINRFLGSTDLDLTLTGSNLLGRGELVSLDGSWWGNSVNTGNLVGSLNVTLPVTPDGGKLNLYGNYNAYRLLDELYSANINGSTGNLRLGFQQPFWRRPQESLWGTVSGEINSYIDNIQTTEIRNKNSQVARLSLMGQKQDAILGTGLNTALLQYSLGNLDRSGNAYDLFLDSLTANTDGVFNKVGLVLSRYQVFSDRWQAKVFIQSQGGFNNLDGAEKISLGYPNGVRAYPPGEAPGDSGVSGQFDLIYRAAPLLSFVAFFDGGYVWRWTTPFAGSLQPNGYGLAGAGVGADLGTPGEWLVSLKVGFPIGNNAGNLDNTDADGYNKGARVWGSLRWWF